MTELARSNVGLDGEAHGGLIPTGTTALFTIIGSPVVQVVAPRTFNRLFAEHGHDAVLVAFDLAPDAVGAFFDAMRETHNFGGGFVTIPHKQHAARHMDELTPRASTLGVVNAVKHVDGRLVGDATDGTAFLAASRCCGFEPVGARVAMIGGGATATAVAHACAEQGVAELALSVRDPARHKGLLRVVESVAAPPLVRFDLDSLAGFDLVINATPVGMNGDPNVPHPVASLDSTSLVGEVVTLPRDHTMVGGRTRARLRCAVRRRHVEGASRSRGFMVGIRFPAPRLRRLWSGGLKADKHLVERGRRHIVGDEGIPDVAHQDESELAALAFLVAMHRLDQSVRRHHGRQRGCQADSGDQGFDAISETRQRESSELGKASRSNETEPDCFPVDKDVAPDVLEGVGEGVPEVEDRSACFLERIVLDDRDLDLDGERDQRLQPAQRVTFLVTQRVPLPALELVEQVRTGDQGVLDHLGHSRGELAATERL